MHNLVLRQPFDNYTITKGTLKKLAYKPKDNTMYKKTDDKGGEHELILPHDPRLSESFLHKFVI